MVLLYRYENGQQAGIVNELLKNMKRSMFLFLGVGLVGCCSSSPVPPLSQQEAGVLCLQLANAKTEALYGHQPFQSGVLPKFQGGQWVWSEKNAYGTADVLGTVELAADGSTNDVSIEVDVNQNILPR
jgi:hypothetical protein